MIDKITHMNLIEVPLSSGIFTLGVVVQTNSGIVEWDASPLGTTTGELDPSGLGYDTAREHFLLLKNDILGCSVLEQKEIDEIIFKHLGDSTGDHIDGANLAIAISSAVARCAAYYKRIPLYMYVAELFDTKPCIPKVMCNILGGGGHHANNMVTTELMILSQDYQKLPYKDIITVRNYVHDKLVENGEEPRLGLEGCLVSNIINDVDAIEMLISESKKVFTNNPVSLGLDLAGFDNDYNFVRDLCDRFPEIRYVEDPFPVSRPELYSKLLDNFPAKMIAGDDLTVGRTSLINKAYKCKAVNTIVLKLNHVGTLSQMASAVETSKNLELVTVCSQRSQETARNSNSHFAIAFAFDYLKNGAPLRERIANYSNLKAIEQFI